MEEEEKEEEEGEFSVCGTDFTYSSGGLPLIRGAQCVLMTVYSRGIVQDACLVFLLLLHFIFFCAFF